MPRTASGIEVLEQAQRALREAQTVEELRQAQAVVLPLLLGVSIEQTACVLGVSKGWACQLRRRFIAAGCLVRRPPPEEAPNAYLKRAEEVAFLAPFIERAKAGQIVVVAEVRAALEQRLGRRTAPSTVYNLLHRHAWRKVVPDRVHPQSDPQAQRRWKKKAALATGQAGVQAVEGGERAAARDVPGRGALRAHRGLAPLLVSEAAASGVPRHRQP